MASSSSKREKDELEHKLRNALKDIAIFSKQLEQYKREHGELMLTQYETESKLSESQNECRRLTELLNKPNFEIQRLKTEKNEIALKLSNSVQQIDILKKQLGQIRAENCELTVNKSEIEAKLRKIEDEKRESERREKEAKIRSEKLMEENERREKEMKMRCEKVMEEIERVKKQRKEMEPLRERNLKLERELDFVKTAATSRFKTMGDRLTILEKDVEELMRKASNSGPQPAGTTIGREHQESFVFDAKSEGLTGSKREPTASEEKTASSTPCTHKTTPAPDKIVCLSDYDAVDNHDHDDDDSTSSKFKRKLEIDGAESRRVALKRCEKNMEKLDDKHLDSVPRPVISKSQNTRNEPEDSDKEWEFKADMLHAFRKDPELCLKAVCALYRQQITVGRSNSPALFSGHQGSSDPYALRGATLAKFLLDGDAKGELKKSLVDLEKFDPKGAEECRSIAFAHSTQIFEIYKSKEDPIFAP